jgi:subtilase family serine protease
MNASRDVILLKKRWLGNAFGRGRLVAGIVLLVIMIAPGVQDAIGYAQAPEDLVTLSDNLLPQMRAAHVLGHHTASAQDSNALMTVGVVLTPGNQRQMNTLETEMYQPSSSLYHHWLRTGEFDRLFGPSSSQLASVHGFLRRAGLRVTDGHSALTLLATGTVSQIESAFHTRINDYRLPDGTTFYANSTAIQVPRTLKSMMQGVVGLTNLRVARSLYTSSDKQERRGTKSAYGAGPGGSGLIPAQIASIYNANPIYTSLHTKGQGKVLGVFELSGYSHSDVSAYEQQFGLPNVPLQDKIVGTAPDQTQALEAVLDIELQIALAPNIDKILVYQAVNSDVGALGELQQMAKDNQADSISISWGDCEPDLTASYMKAEATVFAQMAMQGQSVFAASGDDGAFGCKQINGDTSPQVLDPASQPNVTAVGGTSFASTTLLGSDYDPGTDAHPGYQAGKEVAWSKSGGGNSRVWARPDYQQGVGVDEASYSQNGNWCGQSQGGACREVPDVSLNADPQTGYAVYCTDSADQNCSASVTYNGWVRVGGTSASAPLWAAFGALIDSHYGHRAGLLNHAFYALDSSTDYASYTSAFHDIVVGNNSAGGFFDRGYPAGAGYDMVTGLGTPDMYRLLQLL